MDFIMNLMDQIQKSAVFQTLQQLSVIDWIVIFVVLWGMFQGARKGFSEMIGSALEILLVGILVLTFYPELALTLTRMITSIPRSVADPVAFIILSVFVWLSVAWCFKMLGKFLKLEIAGSLKTLGGFLAGGAYLFLILSFVTQLLLLFPVKAIQKAFHKGSSYAGSALAETLPAIQKTITGIASKKPKGLDLKAS